VPSDERLADRFAALSIAAIGSADASSELATLQGVVVLPDRPRTLPVKAYARPLAPAFAGTARHHGGRS
jgi:hypothetical protein